MIKAILIFISTLIFFTGCKKEAKTTVITLQVTATNSSKIDITYNNVLGNKTMVIANAAWALEITNPVKPYTAYILAASSSPFSSVTTDCTVNILVDGVVVKTATASSNSVATAEAEYTVQ